MPKGMALSRKWEGRDSEGLGADAGTRVMRVTEEANPPGAVNHEKAIVLAVDDTGGDKAWD